MNKVLTNGRKPAIHPDENARTIAESPKPDRPKPKRFRHLPQKIFYAIAGVAIVGGTVLALRPSPLLVDMQPVERQDLQVTVNAEGKTRLQSRYTVSAPVAGRLRRMNWDEGDRVARGQVLARLDPLPLTSQIEAANAKIAALKAERDGVATLRPKEEALARIRANIRGLQAQKQAALARAEEVEASLEQAKRDRLRLGTLVKEGALPQQDLELAELAETRRRQELEVARRAVERLVADIRATREDLTRVRAEQRDPDYQLRVYDAEIASIQAEIQRLSNDAAQTLITAPTSGRVLRVYEESDRYVSEGTPLLELGNTQALELVIDVLSTDAVKIKPGATIWVEHWGGEQPLEARVRAIEPSAFTKVSALGVEEQRVNIIADLVDPPPTLGDGYRVEARIVIWEEKETLSVPLSAVFRCERDRASVSAREYRWCAFVVEEGKAQKRQIAIGQKNDFLVAIQSGLEAQEMTILHPSEKLEEGSRVAPR